MEWRLLIILVICMICSNNLAYADLGFSNPYLPKLEAPSVSVSGGGGNVSYGNTTTNNYFINQSTNITTVAENIGNWSADKPYYSNNTNLSATYVPYVGATKDVDITPWQLFTNVLRTNSWYNLVDDARITWDAAAIRWSTIQDWYMGKLTATTINSTGGMIWNGTTAFRISDLNITGTGGSGDNTSFNQSLTDYKYVPYENATRGVNLGKRNLTMNSTLNWPEDPSQIQKLWRLQSTGGDEFEMVYWYDFENLFDDRLVFIKKDGNDGIPDGGFAWVMQNASPSNYNWTVLKIDGDGYAKFSGNVSVSNLTTRTNKLCNDTTCFNLQELNTSTNWNSTGLI